MATLQVQDSSSPPPAIPVDSPLAAQRPELLRPRASQHPSWSGLILRLPGKAPADFEPPSLQWLAGTWHFTHSTLPIWKDKRNITITYDVVPPEGNQQKERLDDIVEYQELTNDKIKSVRGRNVEVGDHDTSGWDWRGKGIIRIASSHWDILGWGVDSRGHAGGEAAQHQWMVTYFIKTVFTPAAVDIYSRTPAGLSDELIVDIKKALKRTEHPELIALCDQLYECRRDNTRHPAPLKHSNSIP